jgi:hypothetical protein
MLKDIIIVNYYNNYLGFANRIRALIIKLLNTFFCPHSLAKRRRESGGGDGSSSGRRRKKRG